MPRPKTVSDEAILEVARRHFLKEGSGASTRQIASDSGVSETVLFQRFGTKDRLFFGAMTLPDIDLDAIFTGGSRKTSVRKNVERYCLSLLDYFREAVPIFMALVTHPSFVMSEFLKDHHIPAMQFGERLAAYLASEAEAGRVGKVDFETVAGVLVSHIHNVAMMDSLSGREIAEARVEVSKAVEVLWTGLAP